MRNLKHLFEYQKFNPNAGLQSKIDAVTEQYLSQACTLSDDELHMVSAAGEPCPNEPPAGEEDADKRQHSDRNI